MPVVIAKPHICRSDLYRCEVESGTNLLDILGKAESCNLYIEVDGKPIERAEWPFVVAKDNQVINIVSVPQDDGFSGILSAIATVALVVAAPYLGAQAAMAMGFGSVQAGTGAITWGTYGALVKGGLTAGITLAGSLAINAFISPQTLPDSSDGAQSRQKPAITGSGNKFNKWGPIPKLYGTYRFYPPHAALYHTEIQGSDQYFRMLLCLGYGPLDIDGQTASSSSTLTDSSGISANIIKIDDTDIGNYDEVEYEIGTIDNLTLFSSDITESNPAATLNLQSTSGDSGWYTDNVSATRTTEVDTDEISIDLVFPNGFYTMGGDGSINTGGSKAQVDFKIEYAPTGTSTWTTVANPWNLSGARKETYRVGKRWKVSRGQYDVRVTRVRSYITDREVVVLDCTWSTLRSIKQSSPVVDNGTEIIYMALRIKATDQLNGIIDQLSVKATSILDVYNGSSWSSAATNNPAWAYADSLSGSHLKNPISQSKLNADALLSWANWCASNNIEFNYLFDQSETVYNRCQKIASTGHASFSIKDGLFGIVRDSDTSGNPAVQAITPRNASGFQAEKVFQKLPHAVRVKFIDGDSGNGSWEEDEIIVYRSGYDSSSATKFETLDTVGVTDQKQAWKEGKYHLRQAQLRPETYSSTLDIENLVATRGDVVKLAYDVIKVGLTWARIKSVSGDDITVDEECPISTGTSYGVQVRLNDGAYFTSTIVDPGSDGYYTTLTCNTAPTGVQAGDLVLFGEAGSESIRCKISQIDYDADLSASLTLVDEAPTIYDLGTPPVYDPHITEPIDVGDIKPGTPLISAYSGASTIIYGVDGSLQASVVVSWAMSSPKVLLEKIDIRWREQSDSDATWHHLEKSVGSSTERIKDVQEGMVLEIQARVMSVYEKWSDWTGTTTHTVQGMSSPPSDLTGFSAAWDPVRRIVSFSWAAITDAVLSHYEIREGSSWDTASVVLDRATGTSDYIDIDAVTDETKTYLIKAVSTTGVYSTNAVSDSVAVDTSQCPLSTPTNVGATSSSVIMPDGTALTTLDISWDDTASNHDAFEYYELQVVEDSSGKNIRYTTPSNSVQIEVKANTDYTLSVRAVARGSTRTAWSVGYSITSAKDLVAPATPTWAATYPILGGIELIALNWNDNTESDLQGYVIERSDTGDFTGEETMLGLISASHFSDTGLSAETTYYYRIKAQDRSGNTSNWSTIQSATTGSATVGPGSITETEIADDAISTPKLQANAVEAAKIAAGSIIANKIAAGAVTADKIDVSQLDAIAADVGTLTAGLLKSANWSSAGGVYVDLTNGVIKVGDDPANPKLEWDGADLKIDGEVVITGVGGDQTLITSGFISAALLTADNIVTGSLDADQVNVTGTLNTNNVRIESGDGKTYFDGDTMYVYDGTSTLRVKIGKL